jgi:hypothetical protein
MSGLCKLAQKFQWQDLPRAISEIRHSIVHPDNETRKVMATTNDDIYCEAWDCSVWMVELVLLKIMGYTGVYADRRKMPRCVGEVSPVPWK